MLRHLFKSKKLKRKDANGTAVLLTYGRAATTLPTNYLTVHQEADAAISQKIRASAQERRERRTTKRQRTNTPKAVQPNPTL